MACSEGGRWPERLCQTEPMSDKIIVTCALSGAAANRQQCPYIPYTPEEYAEEARRARDAGAAVVHVHARKAHDGTPSDDLADNKAIIDAIVARVPDVVVDVATTDETIRELRPELGSLVAGSMNYALVDDGRLTLDAVVSNPLTDVRTTLQTMLDAGTKPVHECFDAGHVHNVALLTDAGVADPHPAFALVLGVHGGIAATVANLVHLVSLLPPGARWHAVGVRHPEQWQLVATAIAMGGSVRAGLEDNFFLDDGRMAASNGDLVEKAVRLAHELGREVAEPNEARAMLRLPVPERAKERAPS